MKENKLILNDRKEFQEYLKVYFIPRMIELGLLESFNIGYALRNWTFFFTDEVVIELKTN